MPDPTFDTMQLQTWLIRLRAGDRDARDELLKSTQARMEGLARRMLRRFPTVGRWADTGDVFQGAAIRLIRALDAVDVANTRSFLNLAALQIRRELLDLARQFGGPHGIARQYVSHIATEGGPAVLDSPAPAEDAELERWAALHVAVDQLPADEREVFGLTFYQQLTQIQIAELLEVDERTVRRRWRRAVEALQSTLGGALPGD
jgi:RNA polymerase sigma factor (sigma-70 family)